MPELLMIVYSIAKFIMSCLEMKLNFLLLLMLHCPAQIAAILMLAAVTLTFHQFQGLITAMVNKIVSPDLDFI